MNMSEKIQSVGSVFPVAGTRIQKAPQGSANVLDISHQGDQMQHLSVLDAETGTVDLYEFPLHQYEVRYQMVYSHMDDDDIGSYCTYGIQCLCKCSVNWVLIDSLNDVSVHSEMVLRLVSQFTAMQLSPLHFRDVVLDSISA